MTHRRCLSQRALSALVAALVVLPALAIAEPARLRLTLEQTTVAVGNSAPVTLEFLDQSFEPTANDRDRVIELDVRATDGSVRSQGEISPSTLVISGGERSFPGIRFTPAESGRVIIRATSDGLARAETLATVVFERSSRLGNFLVPEAHAQPDRAFQLEPPSPDPIPLNQTSTANLWIALNLSAAERLTWKIETTPAVAIRYNGEEKAGFAHVSIDKGMLSAEFQLLQPSKPSSVNVCARLLPEGPEEHVDVEFVAAEPTRISFRNAPYTAAPYERIVPLEIGLVDQGERYLEVLGSAHLIELDPSARLSRGQLKLDPDSPTGHVEVRLAPIRLGGELQLVARDKTNHLSPGKASLQVAATLLALLFIASGGGFLGGLARHVYHVRSSDLLPKRVRGELRPGLVVNGLFGILFGVVFFLSIHLGILPAWEPAILSEIVTRETSAFGFVLGVVGGFAGVLVLERLARHLLNTPSSPDVPQPS